LELTPEKPTPDLQKTEPGEISSKESPKEGEGEIKPKLNPWSEVEVRPVSKPSPGNINQVFNFLENPGNPEISEKTEQVLNTYNLKTANPMLSPQGARQVMQQVIARFALISSEGHSIMRLQLKPEQLGQLRMHLEMEGQNIVAKMQVENQQVKAILEQNQQHLKDALDNQGIKVSNFEVSVKKENSQTDFDKVWKDKWHKTGRIGLKEENQDNYTEAKTLVLGQDTGRRYGYNTMELVA
jgi:flagellar hook-length control protein FliK